MLIMKPLSSLSHGFISIYSMIGKLLYGYLMVVIHYKTWAKFAVTNVSDSVPDTFIA